jgi:hypothetical protein
MRTLKKYVPRNEFDLPKQFDLIRDTAVLIRQSDHKADEQHSFSRESQLKLVAYAQRLRCDATHEHVRVYDEGAGVSGQKRIDERVELNRLYNDIVQGTIGSLVIVHEDRLFRDQYHTSDTMFIEVLAKHNVLLFVRTDHRRYDCTKPSDRNVLLEKMIASRNYLDDHVLGRMNGNQEAKALQGLFDGRNLAMGYVTQGKKKQQALLIYEPWARVIRWMFERFRELDSFRALYRELETMPYLFPDPTPDDLMRYAFKIRMRRVAGGFKPSTTESVKFILTNPTYIGAWVYDGAIVREGNHPAIVDRELFMWSYHTLTGRDLQGQYLNGVPPRRLRDANAQAVLKYILRDPKGPLYVTRPEHPEYIREELSRDAAQAGRLIRDTTFAIRAHLIDNIFLDRAKEIARRDAHLATHIRTSLEQLEQTHAGAIVSVAEHLAQVRKEQQKTLAFLHDQILDLTPQDKAKYNSILAGLQEREKELLAAQEQSTHVVLRADLDELEDVLDDLPARLDDCSMERKQCLVRIITESVTIEEVSVHWLRLTVVWRGALADRPDVCLIWRQRGRRSDPWTAEEDDYLRANFPITDKWPMLQALPRRNWNMICNRALGLDVHRTAHTELESDIPSNVCIEDLEVIPDPHLAWQLVVEAGRPRPRAEYQAYPVWLYSADSSDTMRELANRNTNMEGWAGPSSRDRRPVPPPTPAHARAPLRRA